MDRGAARRVLQAQRHPVVVEHEAGREFPVDGFGDREAVGAIGAQGFFIGAVDHEDERSCAMPPGIGFGLRQATAVS